MRKFVVYGCDENYVEMTNFSIRSFLKHNPVGWTPIIMDVGIKSKSIFPDGVELQPYPPAMKNDISYIPSAYARCMAFERYCRGDDLMLYLDSDTIVYANLDRLVESFIASEMTISLLDEGVYGNPIRHTMSMDDAFAQEFSLFGHTLGLHENLWRNKGMLNTGVVLARGPQAVSLGTSCKQIYPQVAHVVKFGEQSVIASLVYELGVSMLPLTPVQHYLYMDGSNDNDLSKQPVHQGMPVLIRHFCYKSKDMLRRFIRSEEGAGLDRTRT